MSKKQETKVTFYIGIFKSCCVVKKEIQTVTAIELPNQTVMDSSPIVTEIKTFQDVDEVWRFIDSHIPKVK